MRSVVPGTANRHAPAGRIAEYREALIVGRLCDKRPFSDADPTRPPSSDQNTADRLSDVIDEATPSFTTSGSLSAHFTTRAPLAYKRAAPRPSVPVKRDLSPAGRGTPTLAAKPRPS